MNRLPPHQIDTTGATSGQALVYDPATDSYVPGGAAGGVASVVAGTGVSVNSTDPAHPVVSVTAAGATELLMADGVTSPPVPIETEAGDDWLYQD